MPENIHHWHTRAVCPKCGWHIYAPFGDVFHVHVSCCEDCGHRKYYDSFRFTSDNVWKIKTMRYVSTVNRWKPKTWGTGHWETRNPLQGRSNVSLECLRRGNS